MMPRPRQLVLAASLAAMAVGCAHCDTCDDFPAPCTGPNCGSPYQATFPYDGESHIEPIVTGPGGEIYGAPMDGAMMAPGTIMSAPPAGGAPSVSPPAPTPANGPSSSGTGTSNGGTSPPDSPPARPSGSDPFELPPPASSSPFGSS